MSNHRDTSLDLMRGTAIIMMIVFHFIYDLNTFGFTNSFIYTLARYSLAMLDSFSIFERGWN